MVVKCGIWIALTTTVSMLCGIMPPGESLAVVGDKVRHAYSSILGQSPCLLKILFRKKALIRENGIARIIANISRQCINMLL